MPRILKRIFQKLNWPIINMLYGPLNKVSSTRPVETIDTLIIGDICSDSVIKRYCSLRHCIKLLMPGRSLSASYILLSHFTSILPKGGKVVIIDGHGQDKLTAYDYPYLSQLSRLEYAIVDQPRKRACPILYIPIKSIQLITKIGGFGYRESECQYPEIVNFCNRKGLQLIYLEHK